MICHYVSMLQSLDGKSCSTLEKLGNESMIPFLFSLFYVLFFTLIADICYLVGGGQEGDTSQARCILHVPRWIQDYRQGLLACCLLGLSPPPPR